VDALLAAHADKAAEAMLDSLTPSLHRTSREQRAIALVLRAELAARHGDDAGTRRALASARTLAGSSGIRLLQLRIALAEARLLGKPAPTLGPDTAALGNAGLRLQWLQLAMQQALARGDAAHARVLYRDALPLLRDGDWLHAGTLHALGARASELQGDADGATAARLRAQAADTALRSSVPPGLLAGFDAAAGKAVAAR
jgi:hypothetical protein